MKNDFILITLTFLLFVSCKEQESFQRDFDFNNNWQFSLSDSDVSKVNSEHNVLWESVNLPHNWNKSIALELRNSEEPMGYLPEKVAYYKKDFHLALSSNQKAFIWFDGDVYDSEFWINGHNLGEHPSGDVSFYFDLSNFLKHDGAPNQLLVKIERSKGEVRSCGMCLDAKLVKVNKLHIPISGTCFKMQRISDQEVNVALDITLNNTYTNHQTANVVSEVFNTSGKLISSTTHADFIVKPGKTHLKQNIALYNSLLKDKDKEQPYFAETKIYTNNTLVDVFKTRLD